LNISREGDSTTPLGSLGQGSVTLKVTKFFLVFRWNLSPQNRVLVVHMSGLKSMVLSPVGVWCQSYLLPTPWWWLALYM